MQLGDQQLPLVGRGPHSHRVLNENSHTTFATTWFKDTGDLPTQSLHCV